MAKKKLITLTVVLSVPPWLTKRQAKDEVRALINQQCFYGHYAPGTYDALGDHNFRARKIS